MNPSPFLGIEFEVGAPTAILNRLKHVICNPGQGSTLVMHGNLNTVYNSTKDQALKAALEHPRTLVLFEGIGLKLARLMTSLRWWPDISGTELVPLFLSCCAERPLRLALVGGHPGIAEAAGQALTRQYPNAVIVKTLNGFADLADEPTCFEHIAQARPDILLLGLGTPIQEVKALAFANGTGTPVIWCVGGLFDLLAGVKKRAPRWVLLCRIEWLWRLIRHPGAYWQRTFVQGPWLLLQILATWRQSR
jgi:exopolysaccharide biosynthesis WecB/TagA/CpsF family protein